MANPLDNEAQIYDQLRQQHIGMDPLIWKVIFRYVGDSLTAINLIVACYYEFDEAVPIEDARKILDYTKNIKDVFDNIMHPEKIEEKCGGFFDIKKRAIALHPLIKELFAHYIANDNCAINFCVNFFLDPGFEEPIPPTEAKKILNHTQSMCAFLTKLREATIAPEVF